MVKKSTRRAATFGVALSFVVGGVALVGPASAMPSGGSAPTVGAVSTVRLVSAKKAFKKGKVVIRGVVSQGKTLTAKASTFSPRPTWYTYQWYRSGKAIAGATSKTYKVKEADAGKKLSVKAKAARSGYKDKTAASANTSVVPKVSWAGGTAGISGTKWVGVRLTATTAGFSPAPTSLTYQWYRNNEGIPNATFKTWQSSVTDLHAKIKVCVTARRNGRNTKTVCSGQYQLNPDGSWRAPFTWGSTVTVNRNGYGTPENTGMTMRAEKPRNITAELKAINPLDWDSNSPREGNVYWLSKITLTNASRDEDLRSAYSWGFLANSGKDYEADYSWDYGCPNDVGRLYPNGDDPVPGGASSWRYVCQEAPTNAFSSGKLYFGWSYSQDYWQ
ncbi:MAG: hypothetical protein LBH13_04395 [Cellulomonadaceae bacterium]|nr:hypothetical protein [Cellulomonadaceae bacterium]